MPGDNFGVRVSSEGRRHLEAAIRMAFEGNAPGGKATHYRSGLPERKCGECQGFGRLSKVPPDFKRGDPMAVIKCQDCHGTGSLKAEPAMILYWHAPENGDRQALPFPLDADAAVSFLADYLESIDYPPEPDHDGSNGKGFIVTTGDFWGHCEGSYYSILMVQPDWQMYGK